VGIYEWLTGETATQVKATATLSPSYASDYQTLRLIGLTRETALGIPAISAGRNLIVNTIAQLAPDRYRGAESLGPGWLLTQPDPSTTWVDTISGTVDDLIFHGFAAWLILARDGIATEANPDGLPVRARRIPADIVTPVLSDRLTDYDQVAGYRVNGQFVEKRNIIYFASGHDGILNYGARTISAAIELEDAARRLSSVELPAGILQNVGHELGPDEAAEVVTAFQTARRTNTIAFLQNVEYSRADLNPQDLQLVEARAIAATDCARLLNIPVSMIGASPTGNSSALLYSNLAQNTAQFVQTACAPYIRAIEDTLSLPSVTARGQRVAFDVQAFLRSDPDAAAQYVLGLYQAGLVNQDEARSFLGIPSVGQSSPDLTPGRI
jgi:HK97 family phage portal protein